MLVEICGRERKVDIEGGVMLGWINVKERGK